MVDLAALRDHGWGEAAKAADKIERLQAALDEADSLIMDLTGAPWEAAYPTGSDKAAAIRNWKARCVDSGKDA